MGITLVLRGQTGSSRRRWKPQRQVMPNRPLNQTGDGFHPTFRTHSEHGICKSVVWDDCQKVQRHLLFRLRRWQLKTANYLALKRAQPHRLFFL
jgi:hypothetical protein